MKKKINKVGFKFSWEQPETENPETKTGVEIIDTTIPEKTKTAFNELATRINDAKKLMVSSAYAKMTKAQRISIMNTYEFYTALHTEYTLNAN